MLPGAVLSCCSAAASRSPLPLIHALSFHSNSLAVPINSNPPGVTL